MKKLLLLLPLLFASTVNAQTATLTISYYDSSLNLQSASSSGTFTANCDGTYSMVPNGSPDFSNVTTANTFIFTYPDLNNSGYYFTVGGTVASYWGYTTDWTLVDYSDDPPAEPEDPLPGTSPLPTVPPLNPAGPVLPGAIIICL